jgi:tetratricopeptide (TPR) repeat protein
MPERSLLLGSPRLALLSPRAGGAWVLGMVLLFAPAARADDGASALERARAHVARQEYDQALAAYTRALGPDQKPALAAPERAAICTERAQVHFRRGDLDHALDDCNSALAADDRNDAAHALRSAIHLLRGNEAEALADCSRALELRPDNALALVYRGSLYFLQGKAAGARADFNRAIQLRPEDAYRARGELRAAAGDYPGAIADFTMLIERRPTDARAYVNRGHVYCRKGAVELALADLDRALELEPRHALALAIRSACRMEQGDLALAVKDCDEALRCDPACTIARQNRGTAYLRLRRSPDDRDRAVADFTAVLEVEPFNVPVRLLRSACYRERGEPGQAIADCNAALRLAPASGAAYLSRARAYLTLAGTAPEGKDPVGNPCQAERLPGMVTCLAFSPDGHQLLSGHDDHSMHVWDAATGRGLGRLIGHEQRVIQAVFLADGRSALSCDASGSVRLWDVLKREELHQFDPSWGAGLALSADGQRVLTRASDERTVRVWELTGDPTTWVRERTAFKGHTTTVARALLDTGGRRALSVALPADDCRLWEVETGKELCAFTGVRNASSVGKVCLAISPDGRRAVGSPVGFGGGPNDPTGENLLRIWNLDRGEQLAVFGGKGVTAGALAFSPTGPFVLSGGPDKLVRVWAVDGPAEVLRLKPHAAAVTAVAFAPDGCRAATGDSTGMLFVWQLPLVGDQAVADCTAALRLDNGNPQAHALRASAHLQRCDYSRALVDCTNALKLDPKCASAYVTRGRLSLLTRSAEDAVRDFTRAIDLEPDNALAFYFRSLARAEQGRIAEARTELETALRLDPSLDRK